MSNQKKIISHNPWTDLPSSSPYVLPIDKQYVDDYNSLSIVDEEYLFHTEIYPEPYAGRVDAMVVLLGFHPGFSDEDAAVHRSEVYQRLWQENVHQSINDYPLFFLHSALKDSPAYQWWYKKLKSVIERTSVEQVANNVVEVQLFPYHCSGLKRPNGALPSKGFSVKLVNAAVQRGALIVAMQSKKLWKEHVPALNTYNRFFCVKNPRSGSVSPGNLPDGFENVIEAVNGGIIHGSVENKILAPKEMNYLPNKSDVEKAIEFVAHDVNSTLVSVLDKVELNCKSEGKLLKSNWRMITERNIEIWFK